MNISGKENRRDFLTKIGLATLAPLLLPKTGLAEIIATEELPDASFFVGLWEDEIWSWSPQGYDYSFFAEARQYADEPQKRIVSAAFKPITGKKVIEITYLEPTAETYPETEGCE
jgi:hypothetical protein